VETSGEANILHRGRLLYPERGPRRHGARMAASLERGPARLYLVASPGLWYGVEDLFAVIDGRSAILCVETDKGLAALARRLMPAGLASSPRCAFVQGADPATLVARARALGSFRHVVLSRLSGGASFDEGSYLRAAAVLEEHFRSEWKNIASLMAMGRLWTRNIFRNLARLEEIAPRPLPRIAGAATVCGAGPSLEAAIPFIATHRDALTVVAADTAVGPLVRSGIVPDLVVCLEAQVWNLADFLPLEGAAPGLIADISSHPSSFAAFPGNKYLTIVSIIEGSFSRRLLAAGFPALPCPPLGSVGVHAVHVTRAISAGPVLLTGLDFSYEAMRTHARDTPAVLADELGMTRLKRGTRQAASSFRPAVRKGRGGELTDPVLTGYAALLADEAALPGPGLYDLRGRGLPIGVEVISFEEAASLIGAVPVRKQPAGTESASSFTSSSTSSSTSSFASSFASSSRPAPKTASGRAFLAEELGRLVDIESLLKGRHGKARAEDLVSAIDASDFLLWAQPDANRLGELPQDLLNRVLLETGYWIAKLEELRDRQ
jgi:hypothetical protein